MGRIDAARLKSVHILFEDDAILVLTKPAGLPVHGGANANRTLIELVQAAYTKPQDIQLVHRLDRGTSGVMILAKGADVARTLAALWPTVKKTYEAIALGAVEQAQRIDQHLADREGRSQSAATRIEPLHVLGHLQPEATWLEAHLETGRTHQIRRHLAGIGHPILMDDRYGDFGANKAWSKAVRAAGGTRPKHLMLHAARLVVPHPVTGEPLTFHAPAPSVWTQILEPSTDSPRP